MKKMIWSVLVLCGVTTFAYAQERNDFWLGGSVSAWTEKEDGMQRLTNVKIMPEFGYQWHDNWGVGVQLGYIHNQTYGTSGNRVHANGLAVNPFVRYSYLKGKVGNLFVDGTVGYGYNKYSALDTKEHNLEVGFRPGVGVHVTDNISLIAKVGFLGYEYNKFGDTKTHSGGLQLDLERVDVGVIVRF